MTTMHRAMKEGLKTLPSVALEKLLQKKFKTVGVRPYKVMAKKFAAHLLSGSEDTFTWEGNDKSGLIEISFDEDDAKELERLSAELIDTIPDIIQRVNSKIAELLMEQFTLEWCKERYQEERFNRGFKDRIEDRWGEALDTLRVMLEVCRQFGQKAQERIDVSRARRGKVVHSVILMLHVRACQVSAEILILLENGYPDGAVARWRTLHEITVVALLLNDGGDEVAQRYIDYEVIEAKKALERYLVDYEALGFRAPVRREIERTQRQYEKMLGKYGPDFRYEYGWAAPMLKKKRPRFIDLQDAAGRAAMHSYYKMASYTIHATPKALSWRVGSIYNNDGPIAGATNAGLDEAGYKLANTLPTITSLLPGAPTKIDNAIEMLILIKLRDKAISIFAAADRKIRKEEREMQRVIQDFESYNPGVQ